MLVSRLPYLQLLPSICIFMYFVYIVCLLCFFFFVCVQMCKWSECIECWCVFVFDVTCYINCFVCACVYLPNCSIQGLSYTRLVLSLYIYLSSFSFSWCTFLPLSPLPSVHSKYLYFFEENCSVCVYGEVVWNNVYICCFSVCVCVCVWYSGNVLNGEVM